MIRNRLSVSWFLSEYLRSFPEGSENRMYRLHAQNKSKAADDDWGIKPFLSLWGLFHIQNRQKINVMFYECLLAVFLFFCFAFVTPLFLGLPQAASPTTVSVWYIPYLKNKSSFCYQCFLYKVNWHNQDMSRLSSSDSWCLHWGCSQLIHAVF